MESEKQIKPIDIVITTWGREWMTELCLMALRNNTQTPYRLIIIDNGSSAQAQTSYLHKTDIYVKLDRNYGLEHAKNIGMQFVESELFVSMDNDILVYKYDQDWLSQLIELMNKNPDYAAICPRPQALIADRMDMFDTEEDLVHFGRVPGYARIMRTEVVNRAGAWNEKRPLRGHEELWMGEKFTQMGYKAGWAPHIKVWHLFGREDTDEWGYPKDWKPEMHGHQPVWPIPKNDKDIIKEEVGIEI